MNVRRFVQTVGLSLVVCALLVAGVQGVEATPLYGATGSNGVSGHLLLLNPTTGAVITDLGALLDASGNAYGITGLAFRPTTGQLFGSTANASPTASAHLVTINPVTALVTDIGSFTGGSTMSDITFDPITDILYGWRSASGHGLYTIDPTTGVASLVGGATGDFGGGGLAASLDGTLYNTPDGGTAAGTLTTVDKTTGAPTTVGVLAGGPTPRIINAMDFDSAGVLYGVQTNRDPTALTHLVTIDRTTAVVTDIGASANNLDAIAFLQPVPEPSTWLLLATGLVGLLACGWRRRQRTA